MGILRNIAYKTAVKKGLLYFTEEIENYQKVYPDVAFGEALWKLDELRDWCESNNWETWEGLLFGLVYKYARSQMMHDAEFGNKKDFFVMLELVAEWVTRFGGNGENIAWDITKKDS